MVSFLKLTKYLQRNYFNMNFVKLFTTDILKNNVERLLLTFSVCKEQKKTIIIIIIIMMIIIIRNKTKKANKQTNN